MTEPSSQGCPKRIKTSPGAADAASDPVPVGVTEAATAAVSDSDEVAVAVAPIQPIPSAREALADLLQTLVAGSDAYACGGQLLTQIKPNADSPPCLPQIVVGTDAASPPLALPLNEAQTSSLVGVSSRSGVGKVAHDVAVLDEMARKSWELLPHQFAIANEVAWRAGVLAPLLKTIKAQLACEEWVVDAELYKLLLYTEGSFFTKHRDNERIVGMFGTLVIQLPSVYDGAVLRVHSPVHPEKHVLFDFTSASASALTAPAGASIASSVQSASTSSAAAGRAKGATAPPRARSLMDDVHFAAFYADCYHDVSPLTKGTRLVLVYNLTATAPPPSARLNAREFRADAFKLTPTLPQLPDVHLIQRVARELRRFAAETDVDYPDTYSEVYDYDMFSRKRIIRIVVKHGVPVKLCAILSHSYTPSAMRGLHSLKGRDRVVSRLLHDALKCHHETISVPSLAEISAELLMDGSVPTGTFESLSADAPLVQVASWAMNAVAQPNAEPPTFDAFLSFVALWDRGEATPDPAMFTYGPMIPLEPGNAVPDAIASAVDMRALRRDLDQGYAALFAGESEYVWGEDLDYVPNDNWGGIGDIQPTDHSLSLFADEFLLSSEATRRKCFEEGLNFDKLDDGLSFDERDKQQPEEVEFLGNGPVYEGRCYGRVALLLWPRANRAKVQAQSPAGRAVQARARAAGVPLSSEERLWANLPGQARQ
jgi:hypothetical protein